MFTIACCLVVGFGLGLGLGLDLVSGWLVVMHTYLYYFRLSLSHCLTLGVMLCLSERVHWSRGARRDRSVCCTRCRPPRRHQPVPHQHRSVNDHSQSVWPQKSAKNQKSSGARDSEEVPANQCTNTRPATEMTYIVSGGALNSTHSLTPLQYNYRRGVYAISLRCGPYRPIAHFQFERKPAVSDRHWSR